VLFPSKQLGNIKQHLVMMFPFVQMILGALFSIGRFADVMSPFAIFRRRRRVNLRSSRYLEDDPEHQSSRRSRVLGAAAPARRLSERASSLAARVLEAGARARRRRRLVLGDDLLLRAWPRWGRRSAGAGSPERPPRSTPIRR